MEKIFTDEQRENLKRALYERLMAHGSANEIYMLLRDEERAHSNKKETKDD